MLKTIIYSVSLMTFVNCSNNDRLPLIEAILTERFRINKTNETIPFDLIRGISNFYYNNSLNQMINQSKVIRSGQTITDLCQKSITSLNGAFFEANNEYSQNILIIGNLLKEISFYKTRFPKQINKLWADSNQINFVDLSNITLTELRLNDNNISSMNMIKLPKFKGNKTRLNLSRNKFINIDNFEFPELDYLYLSRNNMSSIKNVVFKTNELSLSNNPIKEMKNVTIIIHQNNAKILMSYLQHLNIQIKSDDLKNINFKIIKKSANLSVIFKLNGHEMNSLKYLNIPNGITHLQIRGNPIEFMPDSYPKSLNHIYVDSNITLSDQDWSQINCSNISVHFEDGVY